jgi:type I restriction enzyme S subunit
VKGAWPEVRIVDVAELIRGVTYAKDDARNAQEDGYLPVLRATNIQESRLVLDSDLVFVPGANVSANQTLRAGDIVVATSSGSKHLVGKSALLGREWRGSFGAFCAAIRSKETVEPRYLASFLQSPAYWKQIGEKSMGVNINNLRRGDIESVVLPLPDLDEQRRIVAEIEKQFSRLDEAVATLQSVKANLKRYKAAILKAAVEGLLVETEGGWRQSTLGEEAAIIGGLTKNPKRNDLPLKLPYLRVANVYANELRLDQIEYIGIAEKELEKLLVRKGDLLVVEGNGSPDQIGRVALWNAAIPNCVHQNHLIKVRLGEAVMPEWALIWMLSPVGRHEIEQVSASTSGLHTLSVGKVSRLPIGVPLMDEQSRIVAEVDRQLSILRGVDAEVDASLQRARSLRHATLLKAFLQGDGR